MKTDVRNRQDIELLVRSFYAKVLVDPEIGHFFKHAIASGWDKHLNTMFKFWENVLFYTGDYFGNPLFVHEKLHKTMKFTPQHFERWISLFIQTVDELFSGTNAELAKQRAISIATVMQMKIVG